MKSAEVEGLSSRADASEKKIAELRKSRGQAKMAKNNFKELACDAEDREKVRMELDDAHRG